MKKKYFKVFVIALCIILSGIGLFLYTAPFINFRFAFISKDISGFQIVGDFIETLSGGNKTYVDDDGSGLGTTISLVIALFLIFDNLIYLIRELITANNIEIKSEHDRTQTKLLIKSLFLIFIGVIPLMLNLATLTLTGHSDNPLAKLEWGAISSGILIIVSEIVRIMSNFITE